MNEQETELFEAELRRLKPARVPDEFQSRLNTSPLKPSRQLEKPERSQAWRPDWSLWLRWFAPAATVAVALLIVISQWNPGRKSALPTVTSPAALKVDQVEIDRQLLGSFDAVANTPDGEPVRFRFQQWMEAVTVRDSVRGIEVVQRTPRLEVVPVSFATY